MKIPDDVFETRCRYCFHGRPENENREVPGEQLFSSRYHREFPCNILSICKANKVPGECLSFYPNWIFGICGTCEWSNQFHEGYCTKPSGPKNKRVVYLGEIFSSDDTYWPHYRSTCDFYKVKESLKDLILRDVLRGRSPANFDPDTWRTLGRIEGTPMERRWKAMQEQARLESERLAKEQQERLRAAAPKDEQMTLF